MGVCVGKVLSCFILLLFMKNFLLFTKIIHLLKEKYIVPDDAKSWVLKSIGACWRGYKCRLKKKHFYKLKDNKTRWKNRPKCIPEKDFLQLLNLWNKKEVMVIY